MVLVIHGQVNVTDLRCRLQDATEVCVFSEAIFTSLSKYVPSNLRVTLISEIEWEEACAHTRDTYLDFLIKQPEVNTELVSTSAYCARSEYSTAIEALAVLQVLRKKYPSNTSFRFVTDNPDIGYLATNYVGANARSLFFLIGEVALGTARLLIHLARLIMNFILLKCHFYKWVQLSQKVVAEPGGLVVCSLAKHWDSAGDWRYGFKINERSDATFLVTGLSAGNIQSNSTWRSKKESLMQSAKRVFIVELFVTYGDLLNIIFSWVGQWVSCIRRVSSVDGTPTGPEKYGIQQSYNRAFTLERFRSIHEWGSLAMVKIGARKFFEKQRPQKVLSYHFEFGYGRAIFCAANICGTPQTFGFQHGIISSGKWCYALDARLAGLRATRYVVASNLLVEGALAKQLITNWGRPEESVEIIGAVRMDKYRKILKSSAMVNMASTGVFLLLMDLHCTDSNLDSYVSLIKATHVSIEKIWLRPHPRDLNSDEKLKQVRSRYKDISFDVSKGEMLTDLNRINPERVFGAASNSLLECMAVGRQVQTIRLPGKIALDPIKDLHPNHVSDLHNSDVLQKIFDFDGIGAEQSLNAAMGH